MKLQFVNVSSTLSLWMIDWKRHKRFIVFESILSYILTYDLLFKIMYRYSEGIIVDFILFLGYYFISMEFPNVMVQKLKW